MASNRLYPCQHCGDARLIECLNIGRQIDCPLVEVPSADVVEVVRCKDCSHGYKTSYPSELRICLMTGCANSENHFCSDGKRMDGET